MKYHVLKCKVKDENLFEVNYGLMICRDDGSRGYICNISDSFEELEVFVNKLNLFHIEECHLQAAIEDFKFDSSLKGNK